MSGKQEDDQMEKVSIDLLLLLKEVLRTPGNTEKDRQKVIKDYIKNLVSEGAEE